MFNTVRLKKVGSEQKIWSVLGSEDRQLTAKNHSKPAYRLLPLYCKLSAHRAKLLKLQGF